MEQTRKPAGGNTKPSGAAVAANPARSSGTSIVAKPGTTGASAATKLSAGLGARVRSAWAKAKSIAGGFTGRLGSVLRPRLTWIANRMPTARWKRWAIGSVAVILVVVGVVAAWPRSPGSRVSEFRSWLVSIVTQTRPITGRAVVMDSGLIRVGDTPIRLSSLEALDRDQVCTRAKKRWRCGDAALAALGRIAAGRTLKCEARSPGSDGISAGTCREGKNDIGAALVKSGYAFASSSRYAEEEAEAKTARAGIWSGEADRPDVWRQRVWDEAKQKVPDGCPVKGVIFNGAKVFLIPARAEYDRFRIDPKRGSRWFCSEKDALEAGWKPMER